MIIRPLTTSKESVLSNLTIQGHPVGLFIEPEPPGPSLPPYTIRLRYISGVSPHTYYLNEDATAVQVSSDPNIWDVTYNNTNWYDLLMEQYGLVEVIGANITGVTKVTYLFDDCTSLTSVALFDTSTVTDFQSMFHGCTSLPSIPLFDISNATTLSGMLWNCTSITTAPAFNTGHVSKLSSMFHGCTSLTTVPLYDTTSCTDMGSMFNGCTNVTSGILALYNQASTQSYVPGHFYTFKDCGINTTTGAAELAQIPAGWK